MGCLSDTVSYKKTQNSKKQYTKTSLTVDVSIICKPNTKIVILSYSRILILL